MRLGGFWYPYKDFSDAAARLGRFADRAVSPGCGIIFSDGISLGIVRRPRGSNGQGAWLNVLRHHVVRPRPAPAPKGSLQKLEHWFEQAMESYGRAEIARSEAEMAGSRAIIDAVHDHVWLPTHQFLLRHKIIADGVAVALDVVGVVAGTAFVLAAAPEILGGAAVIGTVGLVTGSLATAGSALLLVTDGAVFVTEVTGNEAVSRRIEDNSTVQWVRITATVMLLPDIPGGGVRALREIGVLGRDAKEAAEAARALEARALAQRERTARISNPSKHPGPVNRHLNASRRAAKAAVEKRAEIDRLHNRMRLLTARDVNASFIASPGSAALLGALPPSKMMRREDVQRDEKLLESLAPEHGMPHDVRLEMRISGTANLAHHP